MYVNIYLTKACFTVFVMLNIAPTLFLFEVLSHLIIVDN